MNIRLAVADDLGELAILFDQYRVFYRQASDLDGSLQFLTDRLSDDSMIFIAADKRNVLAGFTQLYPRLSSTRMQSLWLLNDLFVSPVFRGNGISKMLINRAKTLCRDTNACELILETEKNNSIANRLYIDTGFKKDCDHNYYSWSY